MQRRAGHDEGGHGHKQKRQAQRGGQLAQVVRILQESVQGFIPCRNGRFINNLVTYSIEAVRDRYVAFIAELLELGQGLGYILPVDPRLAAVGIVSLLDGLCNHQLRDGRDVDPQQLSATVSQILSSGLLAR